MALARLRSLPWLLALGAIVVFGLFLRADAQSFLARQAAVRETLSAREVMIETLSRLKDAETGVRGFLLTGDDRFLETYRNARPELLTDLESLRHVGASDPVQRAGASRVDTLSRQKLAFLDELIERQRGHHPSDEEAIVILARGKTAMDTVRVEIGRMLARTDERLREREEAVAAATLHLQLMLGAVLAGGVALALAGLSSARRDAEQARLTNLQLASDIAARKKAEAQLRAQSRLLESVLSNIGDAVVVLDADRETVLINPAAKRIVPYSVGERPSADWSQHQQAFLPDGKTPFPADQGPITRALQGHASDGVEIVLRVNDELRSYSVTTRPISEDGTAVAAVAVFHDTTAIKRAETQLVEKSEALRALSLRDELTGLYNRRGFMEVAEHQLKAAARSLEPCVVFFADLNGMKLINDQLGHEMGDHALRAAADVLTGVFRASDVVARLGGDEFAVFAGDCDELGIATTYARIEERVSELNALSTHRYRLSISTGAAVFHPEDPRNLIDLMQAADAHMYEAKRARHQRASLRVRSG